VHLHADPLERFSIVSFVWGPGQRTPIHDHRVWGLVGVLRGAELSTDYTRTQEGVLAAHKEERLEPGTIIALHLNRRDTHTIRNAFKDRVSVSIHVYGANIGAVGARCSNFLADGKNHLCRVIRTRAYQISGPLRKPEMKAAVRINPVSRLFAWHHRGDAYPAAEQTSHATVRAHLTASCSLAIQRRK
jgi:hypothetical protein